jgi:hypothetical protein
MVEVKNRRRGSGSSHPLRVRLKSHSINSIDTRLAELEMNLSEYVRELIRQDIGIEA